MTGPVEVHTGRRLFGRLLPWLGKAQPCIRNAIVPLDEVAAVVPAGGRFLEIGCGEGLMLGRVLERCQRVVGVDIDERKFRIAQTRFASCPQVELHLRDAFAFLGEVEDGHYATALLADTLSSFPPDMQLPLLREMLRVLEPGGLLVVKAIDGSAGWKTLASKLLSGMVVRLLRMSFTAGRQFTYLAADELQSALAGMGAETRLRHLHRERFHPIPHILVLARKGSGGTP